MGHGTLSWRQRGQLWLRLGLRLALGLLGGVAAVRLLPALLSLFAPFLLALGTACVLNPLIRRLQQRLGWGRRPVTVLVLGGLLGALGGGICLLLYAGGSELAALVRNWDGVMAQLEEALERLQGVAFHIRTHIPPQITRLSQTAADSLLAWLKGTASRVMMSGAEYLKDLAMRLPGMLLGVVVFAAATYFLCADYPYLRSRGAGLLGRRAGRFFAQVQKTALAAFGGYLKAQFLLSAGVFFILLVGFLFLRQDYALLLALSLSLLDFIPIVGAGTVMLPWVGMGLLFGEYTRSAALGILWGITALFRRGAEPKVLGSQTGLSPVLSLVSIYAGMKLAGVAGMILAPVAALVALNLGKTGLFSGLRRDLAAAAADLAGLLDQRL